MRVVADTGPLVAATFRGDEAHELAAAVVTALGRELVVPAPVVVEVDQLLRARVGAHAARRFLGSMARGEHTVVQLTARTFARAVKIDAGFPDLDLGLTDASVMAIAEGHDLPVLTFDFRDFRAAPPASGFWRLVVDERRYAEAIGR